MLYMRTKTMDEANAKMPNKSPTGMVAEALTD
jgi:hypothetical protein